MQGVGEIARHGSDRALEDVWFFILPEGITQEVIINMSNAARLNEEHEPGELSFVVNPLTAAVDVYEKIQLPSPTPSF